MICFPKLKIATGIICFLAWLFLAFPLQAQTTSATNSTIHSLSQGKTWQQMSTVERIQFACIVSAVISFFVAEVWFIVAGFQTSVGWGLFMLFIGGMRSIGAVLAIIGWMIMWTKITRQSEPFHLPIMIGAVYVIFSGCGVIIFIARHWDQARKPLAVMSIGVLLILAVLGLEMTK